MCHKLMQNALQSEGSIFNKSTEQRFCDALERALATYSYDEMFDLAIDSSALVNGMPATRVDLAGFVKMVRSVCRTSEGDPEPSEDWLSSIINSNDVLRSNRRSSWQAGGLNRNEFEKVVTDS